MRQVILDTETTGLEHSEGHRIIEIGCVELLDRRLTGKHYHQYLLPDRDIDEGAMAVHGISNEFLADKPRFAEVAEAFIEYVRGAELIIHNAAFDVGFIDAELKRLGSKWGQVSDYCTVLDTLKIARKKHPGQRNSLDALCKRYEIDNSSRTLHGALLDSEILADVYLAMTGGQTALLLDVQSSANEASGAALADQISSDRAVINIVRANAEELRAHEQYKGLIDKASGDVCVWRKSEVAKIK